MELPLTLEHYADTLPPTSLEIYSKHLKVNQIKDFEHVVKARDKNFLFNS